MFKKYSKSGVATSSIKKDIAALPFEEIQEAYSDEMARETERHLAEENAIALAAYERRVQKKEFTSYGESESSREQEDDSVPDFVRVDELESSLLSRLRVNADENAVVSFAERYAIKESWSWLGPQLIAHLGSYKMAGKIEGKYSALEFAQLNIGKDPRELGIYRFITRVARGKLMEKQVLPEHTHYCALVPLYMAAQKKVNNIRYEEWHRDKIELLVDKDLHAAMVCEQPMGLVDSDELLNIRMAGLSYISKSAKERGATKYYNPETYHALSGVGDSAIGNLPKYAKAMLCQIWCAHPVNRNKYMILDPYAWDNMPEPLVSSTILRNRAVSPAYSGTTVYKNTDVGW